MTNADEWLKRYGSAPLTPETLNEIDYIAATNALCAWMEAQHLTEGQGIIVMTELIGRMLATKMLDSLPMGVAASEAVFSAIAESINSNTKQKRKS